MSPTDSQPKEKASSSSTPVQRPQPVSSTPSLVRRVTGAVDDVYIVGWAFLETLLSVSIGIDLSVDLSVDCSNFDSLQPILDPSSWTRQPTQPVNGGSDSVPRPLFGTGGNRLGGGSSWFGGGAGGGGGGGSGGSGRPRNGGINTLGGLSGGGGSGSASCTGINRSAADHGVVLFYYLAVDACRGTCG